MINNGNDKRNAYEGNQGYVKGNWGYGINTFNLSVAS